MNKRARLLTRCNPIQGGGTSLLWRVTFFLHFLHCACPCLPSLHWGDMFGYEYFHSYHIRSQWCRKMAANYLNVLILRNNKGAQIPYTSFTQCWYTRAAQLVQTSTGQHRSDHYSGMHDRQICMPNTVLECQELIQNKGPWSGPPTNIAVVSAMPGMKLCHRGCYTLDRPMGEAKMTQQWPTLIQTRP